MLDQSTGIKSTRSHSNSKNKQLNNFSDIRVRSMENKSFVRDYMAPKEFIPKCEQAEIFAHKMMENKREWKKKFVKQYKKRDEKWLEQEKLMEEEEKQRKKKRHDEMVQSERQKFEDWKKKMVTLSCQDPKKQEEYEKQYLKEMPFYRKNIRNHDKRTKKKFNLAISKIKKKIPTYRL